MDEFPPLKLRKGVGKSYADGFCVMQAVAWLSGDEHTDSPECACPALATYAIGLNDWMPYNQRKKLRRLIVPLIGTRSPEHKWDREEYIVRRTADEIVATLFEHRHPDYARMAYSNAWQTHPMKYAAMWAMRAKAWDVAIDILDGAIRLGPNGGDDLTAYKPRIRELVKVAAC